MPERNDTSIRRRDGGVPIITDVAGTGTTIRDRIIDDIRHDDLVVRIPAAPPLLLMPLRLEYRVVERRKPPIVVDTIDDRPDAVVRVPRSRVSTREMERIVKARREAIDKIDRTAVNTTAATLRSEQEIWFRWYPDEGFAEKGIPDVTDAEREALSAFDAATGAASWFEIEKPEVAGAFSELAYATGVQRAIHLLRSRADTAGSGDHRIGRIAALPSRVALYAIKNDGEITLLGQGANIPQPTSTQPSPIAYTPAAIETASWLNSFTSAVENGMGLKLQMKESVDAALASDWIVAVGLHAKDASAEVSALIEDGVANGTFAFLKQDTPTNSGSLLAERTDPISYLTGAAQMERGEVERNTSDAADLFASALGLDPARIRKAINAADGSFEDARAMMRVIGPVLIDSTLQTAFGMSDIDELAFIDVMAAAISSRGVLPAIRAGRNPFGVLPMTDIRRLKLHEDDDSSTEASVHRFLKAYATIARDAFPTIADEVVPVLTPDDPDPAGTLEQILQANPVSRRVEVSDVGDDTLDALGCPYVSSTRHPAHQYLKDLRVTPPRDLPDPTAQDRQWPLLYRLARISLELSTVFFQIRAATNTRLTYHDFSALPKDDKVKTRNYQLSGIAVSKLASSRNRYDMLSPQSIEAMRRVARSFTEGLMRLEEISQRPDGTAQLETLFMETLDLFQHRVDAWAVGLAYARLADMRKTNATGLKAGYFGMLSRLQPDSSTGDSDGYIQAPSSPQATTAALLRSAHQRYRDEGTFNIDLSSRRMRRALSLLEMIRNGLSLPEVLGLRGERWLHDRHQDTLIPRLRSVYPMTNPAPPENASGSSGGPARPVTIRLFDGQAFLASNLSQLSADERTSAKDLQTALADDLDALSDLIMCEAVHHRAMGNSGVANAWLQVLSGGHVPNDPAFPRTQRHGQGSSHRTVLLMPPASVRSLANGQPRELAEPTLAAFASRMLGSLTATTVNVLITHHGETSKVLTLPLALEGDLGMRPIDIVIGGESEVRVRARTMAINRWLTDPSISNDLGSLPLSGLDTYLSERVSIAIDLSAGTPSISDLIRKAESLRAMVQRGRALEPSDLNAAAAPSSPLTEDVDITLANAAHAELRTRATALGARIERDRAGLDAARSTFMTAIREAQRVISIPERDAIIAQSVAAAESARRTLITALDAVSRYAEPAALRALTTMDAIGNPDMHDESLRAISDRLARRRAALDAAASAAAVSPGSHEEAMAIRRGLVEALQNALDGAALTILPPIVKAPETTPLLNNTVAINAALGPWAQVREGVRRLQDVADSISGIRAFPVSSEATNDDAGQADSRPEAEAPRSSHFGVFVGDPAAIGGTSFTGVVSDEWVEQRPSQNQLSAVAVNYTSPQSEPPHVLLLCVPPDDSLRSWNEQRAAEMVAEAIRWMKIRAIPTDHPELPLTLLPNANQVPPNTAASVPNRIPTAKYHSVPIDHILGRVGIVFERGASGNVGINGAGFHEIRGHASSSRR